MKRILAALVAEKGTVAIALFLIFWIVSTWVAVPGPIR
jgi:hypothetical protein